MKILLLQDFMKYFNINKSVTFDEFKNKAVTNRGILIKDWLDTFPSTDIRCQNKNLILERLYQIMVIDRYKNLELWYNQHIYMDNIKNYTNFKLDTNILDGNIIKGRINNLTRINKNLFFEDIYNTKKISFNTKPTLFQTLKAFFEEYCLFRCASLPMGIKKVLDNNVGALYAILRGTENKASTFNPYTAGCIFQDIYKAKKVFTPTLGWGAYLMGFFNTNGVEYVGVDVIPKVVDVCGEISKYYGTKNTKFICCPSEQLDSRLNFSSDYQKHFDSIFLSPPYFELEKYDGGEQSISNFPNYKDWLEGYWRATCEICSKVITDDGHFGFVVSDYKNKNWVSLSDDLLAIAQDYFDLEQHYLLGWNSFKILDSEKMKNGNFENFYFMKAKIK